MVKAKANLSDRIDFLGGVEFVRAAADGGDEGKRPSFTVNAYNGGPMHVGGFYYPVVLDLAGIRSGLVAVLRDHDASKVLGQGTAKIGARSIVVKGTMTGDHTDPADPAYDIMKHVRNGFVWSASVGVSVDKSEILEEKLKAKVNGKTVTGPVIIIRAGRLAEVSFLSIGADETASVKIAAQAATKGASMEFEKWLEAMGLAVDSISDEQETKLRAKFDAEQAEPEPVVKVRAKPGPKAKVSAAAVVATDDDEDPVAARRAEAAAEEARLANVREICGAGHPKILAQAISEGWDTVKAELEVLRADRPQTPSIHVPDSRVTGAILEAACLVAGRAKGVEESLGDEVLQAAHDQFHGRIGLQELMLEAAWANGYQGRSSRNLREVLQAAFTPSVNAAFSNADISGILGNVANKFLLDGFYAVEDTWRKISAVRGVSDFKTNTSYRLTGTSQYEKVAPDGEIQHGTLAEESFTNKADTYGLMLQITRQDMINDDLGALVDVPRKLGRGSALKVNDVFWTEWMDNGAFFTAALNNYISGATTNLGVNGLTAGELAFMAIVDADDKPTGVMPRILLVPPALSVVAAQLMKSLELRDTTTNTKYPVANPHQGKFEVAVSRYLSNSSYTGYSTTAWYLVADAPNGDLAAIETVFLDGKEAPTVESTSADFDILGIKMRGVHDFGVNKQDTRGALMSKGAA